MELNKALGREVTHKRIVALNSSWMEWEGMKRRVRFGKIEHWWGLWKSCPEGFPKCKTFIDVLCQQNLYQKKTYREWREDKKALAEKQSQNKIISGEEKD